MIDNVCVKFGYDPPIRRLLARQRKRATSRLPPSSL